MTSQELTKTVKFGAWGASIALIFYIFLSNLTPWGAQMIYSMQETNGISLLGPMTRINVVSEGGKLIPEQINDITYFTTKMPFSFEKARIRLTYLNPYPDQMIKVGYKDQNIWHYHTEIIEAPVLRNLTWERVGTGPYLYQKEMKYDLVEKFLVDPPRDAVIGTYGYDNTYLRDYEARVENYQPSQAPTEINVPLRGRAIMYVYLENEPFQMTFSKQDLNWYEDPDPMTIKVYKGRDLVYTSTIADDGITDASKRTNATIEATIQNPGPGLPENGVYKIVIDASGDAVLKNIKTNLHKIVFEGSINPIDNHEVYPTAVKETKETKIYTKSKEIELQTFHQQGVQDVQVDNEKISLDNTHNPKIASPSSEIAEISAPKSDIVLNTRGYFSLNKDQYFEPTQFKVVDVKNIDDLKHVDYLLTNYTPPLNSANGWQVSEKEFNLKDAVVDKGNLSWIIQIPGIKDRPSGVKIKSIEVQLDKEGWKQ